VTGKDSKRGKRGERSMIRSNYRKKKRRTGEGSQVGEETLTRRALRESQRCTMGGGNPRPGCSQSGERAKKLKSKKANLYYEGRHSHSWGRGKRTSSDGTELT